MALSNIEKARFSFVYAHPFFAQLFFNLKVVEVDKEFFGYDAINSETGEVTRKYRTEFGGVSAKNLYVIKENLEKLNKDQIIRFFAHETMHLFMDHIRRGKGRHGGRYNVAADIALEHILESEGIGKAIPNTYGDMIVKQKNGEYKPTITINNPAGIPFTIDVGIDYLAFEGMTTEEIYDGLGNFSGFDDGDLEFSADGEPDFTDAELKGMIARAANTAKMCGKMPGGAVGKIIEEILDPKLPWETLLKRFFSARMKKRLNWKTPNRQLLAQGLYFGEYVKDTGLDEIVVIEDDSGSISDAERLAYNNELCGIFKTVQPQKIHKIHWDTDLIEEMTLKNLAEAKRKAKIVNGCGTDMCAAVVYARKKYPKAKVVVVLTDGYTEWTAVPKPDDVLWVITTNVVSGSGGKTVHLKID